MKEYLSLNPVDETKSMVMSRAGELRAEGYDSSEALSQAWAESRGENPFIPYPYGEGGMIMPNPKRRKRNPSPKVNLMTLLLVGGLSWVIYRRVKDQKWPWQKTTTVQYKVNR